MKYDNPTIKQAVGTSIRNNYGFDIKRMVFIPVGEESYAYKAIASNGKAYFAKYCGKPNIVKTINQVNSFLVEIVNKKYVVPPIVSNGNFSFELLEGRVYVYPYVEGEILTIPNEEFGKSLVNEITNIMADVHNIDINTVNTILPVEKFDTKTFIDSYKLLGKPPKAEVQNKVFKELWKKYHKGLGNYINDYVSQGQKYQKNLPNMVITHGDITGRNIILSEKGMMLVDWDGITLAPREKDLIFYLDNPNFSIDSYLKLIRQASYQPELAKYYGQRWAIESILDNFEKLSNAGTADELVKEYVDEIENYIDSRSFK